MPGPGPTNWTFESADSSTGSSAALVATSGTVLPNIGDLMIMGTLNSSATTTNTSATAGDSSVGGATWTALDSVFNIGKFSGAAFFKIANANDYNGGAGITTKVTYAGGTGTQSTKLQCDVFRLPAGYVVYQGFDIVTVLSQTAATTSISGGSAAGTKYGGFTDALAWGMLATSASNGGGVSVSYLTAVNSETALTVCLTANDTLLYCAASGGWTPGGNSIQNTWLAAWTTSRADPIVIAGTFLYNPPYVPDGYVPAAQGKREAVSRAANWMKDRASELWVPPKARERIVIAGAA
jgi:hypothetical protein